MAKKKEPMWRVVHEDTIYFESSDLIDCLLFKKRLGRGYVENRYNVNEYNTTSGEKFSRKHVDRLIEMLAEALGAIENPEPIRTKIKPVQKYPKEMYVHFKWKGQKGIGKVIDWQERTGIYTVRPDGSVHAYVIPEDEILGLVEVDDS